MKIMRTAFPLIAIGTHLLALFAFAAGIGYEPRLAVAAGAALVVAFGCVVMTGVYAWLLRSTQQTRVRVRTGQRFWMILAIAMGVASIAAFTTISDATVAGFFAGMALHSLQGTATTERERIGS